MSVRLLFSFHSSVKKKTVQKNRFTFLLLLLYCVIVKNKNVHVSFYITVLFTLFTIKLYLEQTNTKTKELVNFERIHFGDIIKQNNIIL